jgi:hypothetical protein
VDATRTATLTPNSNLANSTTYTVTVSGAKDLSGNTMTSTSWSFTTISQSSGGESTIWPGGAVPQNADDSDTSPVELGVKFQSDIVGYVAGVRFYKSANNTGTHVANLWSNAGSLLATITFTGESASGWQTARFSTPVAINADTTYVASYHTNVGHYAGDNNYFSSGGVDSGTLHALADGADGGNGVYRYSANSAFPNSTYQASNYWVDVIFTTTTSADTTPPTITARNPASGATGVPRSVKPTFTFSEAMNASTINTTTVQLRRGTTVVSASVSYNASTRVVTLTPASSLASATTYTVRVTGGSSGVKDLAGNALASTQSWNFTTGTAFAPMSIQDDGAGGNPPSIIRLKDDLFGANESLI